MLCLSFVYQLCYEARRKGVGEEREELSFNSTLCSTLRVWEDLTIKKTNQSQEIFAFAFSCDVLSMNRHR